MNKKEILIHIILFIFTLGIGNIAYLIYCKNSKKLNNNVYTVKISSNEVNNNDNCSGLEIRNRIYKQVDDLRKENENLILLHQKYEQKLEELYKLAIYQEVIENNYTDECLDICDKDMILASKLIDFYKEEQRLMNLAYGHESWGIPKYNSFIRASQLYEKRKMYNEAHTIVANSISLGFLNDGTAGGMKVRLLRLEKKLKN